MSFYIGFVVDLEVVWGYYCNIHILNIILKNQHINGPVSFKRRVWGNPARKCRFSLWRLVDRDSLNTVVWCIYLMCRWFGAKSHCVFFFLLLFLILVFCVSSCKILEQPLQLFFSSLLILMLMIIMFLISYAIINDFQFHPY